jgi:hypothetical protein
VVWSLIMQTYYVLMTFLWMWAQSAGKCDIDLAGSLVGCAEEVDGESTSPWGEG